MADLHVTIITIIVVGVIVAVINHGYHHQHHSDYYGTPIASGSYIARSTGAFQRVIAFESTSQTVRTQAQ